MSHAPQRVHGLFGGFIPRWYRIGLDVTARLRAGPRELSILYYQGEKAPCPCVVDGIMLATPASRSGYSSSRARKATHGLMAVTVIRARKAGEVLSYNISDEWLSKMLA